MAILAFWAKHNGSTKYSEKLDAHFRTALRVISEHPKLGRPTSDPDVRVKTIGEYLLFYSCTESDVHVLSVWHNRRNPSGRPF